jgi:OmpA-OmpF porin, OOP family
MSVNLLEMLKSSVAPEITKQAASYLGETPSGVQAAVDAILPTLIGGLMQKGATNDGASTLLNLINTGPTIDAGMLSNLSGLFSGGERTGTLLGIGGTLLRSLFGDKAGSINAALSGMNNMKAGSGGSLMAMITPLLFGMLKNHISSNKLDASGLMKMLADQGQHIAPALSDKTTYAMGLGSVAAFLGGGAAASVMSNAKGATAKATAAENIPSKPVTATAAAPASNEVAMNAMNAMNTARNVPLPEPGGSMWKTLLPIGVLALAAIAGIAYFMKGGDTDKNAASNKQASAPAPAAPTAPPQEAAKPTAEPVKPAMETKPAVEAAKEAMPSPTAEAPKAAEPAPTSASGMKSYALPGGGKMDVAINSIGNRLLAAITTPNANLKKAFNLDKLIFSTDSADLGAEGRQQLQEVAGILKAFPKVEIRLHGHADNSGDPASNKILSSNRAAVVKEELAKLGVATNRMTTDSFSASQPIASNGTEGGRQQNRRVEIAITKR